MKPKLGYDDSLDAFWVHGCGGTLGALLTEVFATNLISDSYKDAAGKTLALGAVDGNPKQILNQLGAVPISWVFAAVGTFLILKLVDVVVGLRVAGEVERTGLDVVEHCEEGYLFEV